MESALMPKPPVPTVPKAWTRLSNRGMPPSSSIPTSTVVIRKYSRYSTRAVSRVRGVSLPTTGPGISALRMFMDRSELPEIMVINTSTPMPPTQWVKLRQNSSPWLMASTSVRIDAPVVVKPLTVSKNASA